QYDGTLDWTASPPLDAHAFISTTTFDALNRPTSVTAPDSSVYRGYFNEGNALHRIDVNLRGAVMATTFVSEIAYNARRQRLQIEYGNGVVTRYAYDAATFRLVSLATTRASDQVGLQQLGYTYDP